MKTFIKTPAWYIYRVVNDTRKLIKNNRLSVVLACVTAILVVLSVTATSPLTSRKSLQSNSVFSETFKFHIPRQYADGDWEGSRQKRSTSENFTDSGGTELHMLQVDSTKQREIYSESRQLRKHFKDDSKNQVNGQKISDAFDTTENLVVSENVGVPGIIKYKEVEMKKEQKADTFVKVISNTASRYLQNRRGKSSVTTRNHTDAHIRSNTPRVIHSGRVSANGSSGARQQIYRTNSHIVGKARINPLTLFDDDIKKMAKASTGMPWPEVKQMLVTKTTPGRIDPYDFNIEVKTKENCDILHNAVERYKMELKNLGAYAKKLQANRDQLPSKLFQPQDDVNILVIFVAHECTKQYPHLHMDESYSLILEDSIAMLRASTVWGVLRGLETFYQMLYVPNPYQGKVHIKRVKISDSPTYSYRGVLLDTARHFLSMDTIFRNIDAMSQNKFNTLHWHLVDDQSFPFKSERFPNLWKKGAFAYDKTYSFEQISEVIEYARDRGIRVIPEFDTPGHTRGWLGQPDLLTDCGKSRQQKTGVFDVTKNSTYSFLEKFYSEVRSLFKDTTVHIGGDEVSVVCWYKNEEILKLLQNYTHFELLNKYFSRLHDVLHKVDSTLNTMVWEEVFNKYNVQLNPNKTVIEVWLDTNTLTTAAAKGFEVIFAGCWYMDKQRSERPEWQPFYDCDPTRFIRSEALKKKLIGGEACMWAEWVDDTNELQRLWPRAIAPAERLWNPTSKKSANIDVQERFQEQLCRMKRRGIQVTLISGPGDCDGRIPFDITSPEVT